MTARGRPRRRVGADEYAHHPELRAQGEGVHRDQRRRQEGGPEGGGSSARGGGARRPRRRLLPHPVAHRVWSGKGSGVMEAGGLDVGGQLAVPSNAHHPPPRRDPRPTCLRRSVLRSSAAVLSDCQSRAFASARGVTQVALSRATRSTQKKGEPNPINH